MGDEDWVLYFITLFTFVVIFSFCYIRYVYTYFERKRISSASYPTFPFGNAYEVIFQKTPTFMLLWKFYNRFKRKGCKFGGFYLFLKPVYLIVDSDLITTLLNRKDYFEKLNNEKIYDIDEELSNEILSCPLKPIHDVWTKLDSHQFAHDEEVNFSHVMDTDFSEMMLMHFFDLKVKKNQKPEKRNMFVIFKRFISIITCSQFDIFSKNSDGSTRIFYKNSLEQVITNRKKNNVQKDVLQVLLENGFAINEIVDLILTLVNFLEKTNNLVLFTLFELSLNTDIQEDLRGEITRFKKTKPVFTYNELGELSFLETVICETLRKYPLNPFMYFVCKNEYEQKDVNFEKGSLLFVSTFGMHHDPQNYINPELFDPDRFSEENQKFINPNKYLPFGYHTENNFGSLYVKLVMKLTLIELLTKFEFSLGRKSPKYLSFDERVFGLKNKEDMWFKIKRIM